MDNNNFLLNAVLPYQTYHHCDKADAMLTLSSAL